MAGNTWADNKCAAAKQAETKDQAAYDTAKPTVDHSLTYDDYFNMAQTCFSTPASYCDSTYNLEDFTAAPPSGKAAGKAAYSWKYSYTGHDAIEPWSVCQYTATMPHTVKDGKTHYSFKGGLLLH